MVQAGGAQHSVWTELVSQILSGFEVLTAPSVLFSRFLGHARFSERLRIALDQLIGEVPLPKFHESCPEPGHGHPGA